MDRRNCGKRRETLIGHVELAANDRLIETVDAALGRMWERYSPGELRELSQSLRNGQSSPVVGRLDSDLAKLAAVDFGGDS